MDGLKHHRLCIMPVAATFLNHWNGRTIHMGHSAFERSPFVQPVNSLSWISQCLVPACGGQHLWKELVSPQRLMPHQSLNDMMAPPLLSSFDCTKFRFDCAGWTLCVVHTKGGH